MKEHTGNFWHKVGVVTVSSVIPVLVSGLVRALGLYVFVSPNNFAPGGTNGIAVMLEYATGIDYGWFLLFINIPLFFLAYFLMGRREAVISTLSMLCTSGLSILFKYIPVVKDWRYIPSDNKILAAIAGGIFLGVAFAVTIRSCGTAGGTAVLASLVHKKFRNLSVSWLTSGFDACVVFVSMFVYRGATITETLDPVILALISLAVTSMIGDVILQGFKTAYRFEIVTNHPEEIAGEIMEKTHHGVTKLEAEGMYSHTGHSVLICIIRKRQIADVQRIIKKYPDTFASFAPTSEVYGKFVK